MQLEIQKVGFHYKRGPKILNSISFSVDVGERVGIVGPSGYGKSTLSKILAGYLRPTEGNILFNGDVLPQTGYHPIQLIYQHPEKSINPRWKIKDILFESWSPSQYFLKDMGIEENWLDRWPNELSGGQLQRVCIARALGPQTKFIIADEMTTMFDAVTQAQIWEVMMKVIKERNMSMIVITHNEFLAQRLCTKIIELPSINKI